MGTTNGLRSGDLVDGHESEDPGFEQIDGTGVRGGRVRTTTVGAERGAFALGMVVGTAGDTGGERLAAVLGWVPVFLTFTTTTRRGDIGADGTIIEANSE